MEEKRIYTGNDIIKMIFEEKKNDFKKCIIEGDLAIFSHKEISLAEDILNLSDCIIRGELSIDTKNIDIEIILLKKAIISNCVYIHNADLDFLNMEGIRTGTIRLEKTSVKEWDLERAEIKDDIRLNKTRFERIFLTDAEYRYLFVDDFNLGLAAKLSKEGIIVPVPFPVPNKKFNWLIQSEI